MFWLVSGALAGGLVLTSSAFESGSPIPKAHTCQGADRAVPLDWSGVPEGTKSFALVVDDPDAPDPKAPKVRWVHWVVYDLPAAISSVPEGSPQPELPQGSRIGTNDWTRADWGGPCPPIGRHRYVFTLYALDTVLGDRGALGRDALREALSGHILAEASLVGTYVKE